MTDPLEARKVYHENMKVKKAMLYVMENWDKGREEELGVREQATFNAYVDLIEVVRAGVFED